jgi:hypothetical protein
VNEATYVITLDLLYLPAKEILSYPFDLGLTDNVYDVAAISVRFSSYPDSPTQLPVRLFVLVPA